MARNRKRAKDRRTRRPPQAGGSQPGNRSSIPGVLPGVPTVTDVSDEPSRPLERDENGAPEPLERDENGAPQPLERDENGAPEPLERDENGAPQPLEHAMPDVEFAESQVARGRPAEPEPEDEADEAEFEAEVEESIEERPGREPVAVAPAHVEHRAGIFERLIGFLQGCWRELQRVQWPDRRQVMQATGVVIGFVIVAAIFLGVADWVSGKVVTFILK